MPLNEKRTQTAYECTSTGLRWCSYQLMRMLGTRLTMQVVLMMLVAALLAHTSTALVARRVITSGQKFVLQSTNEEIVLAGPNVVVKGPPYLPDVSGVLPCSADNVNSACAATGSCATCDTFNQGDVDLILSQGRNFIRLGVVWAGAQPRDEPNLDPAFLKRLHAVS